MCWHMTGSAEARYYLMVGAAGVAAVHNGLGDELPPLDCFAKQPPSTACTRREMSGRVIPAGDKRQLLDFRFNQRGRHPADWRHLLATKFRAAAG